MGKNGKEGESFLTKLDEVSLACGLEEVGGRPSECPNNPLRYPENHRPRVCQQCPGDPEIWQVAKLPLSAIFLKTKQGGEIILPNPIVPNEPLTKTP